VKRLFGVALIVGLALACGPSAISNPTPGSTASLTTSHSPLLVYTKWMLDSNVSTGAEPGYKPAFTGLTAHDIRTAIPAIDASGTHWVINISFTARGADLFRRLTHDTMLACPNQMDNCPQRHLAIWLDLTQMDINNWDDPRYAAKVSQLFDLSCLMQITATTVCPKLLTDAVTLQEVYGGNAMITSDFTERTATDVAMAINSTSHS
jgi:preprotein translocase subunit SecD